MSIIFIRAKHTDNPDGLPDEWPVRKLPYSGDVPRNWEHSTIEEFNAIKESLRDEYEAWKAAYIEMKEERNALIDICPDRVEVKIPCIISHFIKQSDLTDAEIDLVILSDQLSTCHKYIRSGFVEKGIKSLVTARVPDGVRTAEWKSVIRNIQTTYESLFA